MHEHGGDNDEEDNNNNNNNLGDYLTQLHKQHYSIRHPKVTPMTIHSIRSLYNDWQQIINVAIMELPTIGNPPPPPPNNGPTLPIYRESYKDDQQYKVASAILENKSCLWGIIKTNLDTMNDILSSLGEHFLKISNEPQAGNLSNTIHAYRIRFNKAWKVVTASQEKLEKLLKREKQFLKEVAPPSSSLQKSPTTSKNYFFGPGMTTTTSTGVPPASTTSIMTNPLFAPTPPKPTTTSFQPKPPPPPPVIISSGKPNLTLGQFIQNFITHLTCSHQYYSYPIYPSKLSKGPTIDITNPSGGKMLRIKLNPNWNGLFCKLPLRAPPVQGIILDFVPTSIESLQLDFPSILWNKDKTFIDKKITNLSQSSIDDLLAFFKTSLKGNKQNPTASNNVVDILHSLQLTNTIPLNSDKFYMNTQLFSGLFQVLYGLFQNKYNTVYFFDITESETTITSKFAQHPKDIVDSTKSLDAKDPLVSKFQMDLRTALSQEMNFVFLHNAILMDLFTQLTIPNSTIKTWWNWWIILSDQIGPYFKIKSNEDDVSILDRSISHDKVDPVAVPYLRYFWNMAWSIMFTSPFFGPFAAFPTFQTTITSNIVYANWFGVVMDQSLSGNAKTGVVPNDNPTDHYVNSRFFISSFVRFISVFNIPLSSVENSKTFINYPVFRNYIHKELELYVLAPGKLLSLPHLLYFKKTNPYTILVEYLTFIDKTQKEDRVNSISQVLLDWLQIEKLPSDWSTDLDESSKTEHSDWDLEYNLNQGKMNSFKTNRDVIKVIFLYLGPFCLLLNTLLNTPTVEKIPDQSTIGLNTTTTSPLGSPTTFKITIEKWIKSINKTFKLFWDILGFELTIRTLESKYTILWPIIDNKTKEEAKWEPGVGVEKIWYRLLEQFVWCMGFTGDLILCQTKTEEKMKELEELKGQPADIVPEQIRNAKVISFEYIFNVSNFIMEQVHNTNNIVPEASGVESDVEDFKLADVDPELGKIVKIIIAEPLNITTHTVPIDTTTTTQVPFLGTQPNTPTDNEDWLHWFDTPPPPPPPLLSSSTIVVSDQPQKLL